jgi:protein arginine kinase activator
MICQVCHQNEATIHFTEVVNESVRKLELCAECAAEKGITQIVSGVDVDMSELVAEAVTENEPDEGIGDEKTTCAFCGYTYADFRKSGRLGCPECYLHFQSRLIPLLRDLHGRESVRHVGKSPRTLRVLFERRNRLETMRHDLEEAIRKEAYEEAARLRDQMRILEAEEGSS